MRPRKTVLIASPSAVTCGQLRIVLETRSYAVRTATPSLEILPLATVAEVCLFVGLEEQDRLALESELHRARCGCRVVSVPAQGRQDTGLWIAALLETLRLATIRKRGPKPVPDCVKARAAAAGAIARAQGRLAKHFSPRKDSGA
jgi:hypothetical protein